MTKYTVDWDRDFAIDQACEDLDLLQDLLVILNESSHEELAQLKEACAQGDHSMARDMAHSIKGSALNLGMNGLGKLAYEIEKKAEENDMDGVRILLPDLEELLNEIKNLK